MRTNQTRRRLAAAAITPLFVLALAACGGDDDKDDSKGSEKETTSQSPAANETETESEESPDTEAPQAAAGDEMDPIEFTRLVEDGIEKSEVGEYTMTMTAAGMEITAEGLMDFSGEQPATQMTMTVPGAGEMEMIMVDGTMYMKMPGATGGNGKWMKMDAEEALASAGSAGALDMRQSLNAFVKGVEKVAVVGQEKVNGIDSTHYQVTADSAAISEMMGSSGAGAGAVEMPAKVTYDIWLDDQGRYTKMDTDLGGSGAMSMDITSWDSTDEIKAPPASDVQEMDVPTMPAG